MSLSTEASATVTSPSSSEPRQTPKQDMASGRFPLGYKDAAYQWWTLVSPRTAERAVLASIPYLKEATDDAAAPLSSPRNLAKTDPFGQRIWRQSMVKLSGKNRALNELSVERLGEPHAQDTLVMLHGYGAGLGFFYKNLEPLSRLPGWKLYALDMLGMGNSSRPTFKIHAKDQEGKTREAEGFFIDALEEWRKLHQIDKFTLLGHSMGGYLAVCYALKYPGHLNKLILASPVGVPEDPYAVRADMPEPGASTLAQEFTQDQQSIVDNTSPPTTQDNKTPSAAQDAKLQKRPYASWLVWLWDANVSPFSLVRAAGPLGPRLVSGWTSRRFNHLPSEEAQALHSYAYTVFRQSGSGEYALPFILAPGAFARSPLIHRIQEVGRQVITPATETKPAVRETGIPVVFMYGDNDWMDVAGGYAAVEKIKARVVQALLHGTDVEKQQENGSAKVMVVKKAGHHLYLDNPDDFNEAVLKEMRQTQEEIARRKA